MRKLFKIFSVAGFTAVLFVSCLKDDPITDYTDKAIKPVVLIPNGNFPRNSSITPLGIDFTPMPYIQRLYARVSWDKPLSKSIDVTFKEDDVAISDYNTSFGTNYVKLNSNAYQIPSLKVTIPAGQKEAYIPITIFPDKVNLAQDNMLSFTITDASGETIASNFKTFLLPLIIKNIYDADYTTTGYVFHPSAPRALDDVKHIYTVTDVTSEAGVGDLYPQNYWFRFNVTGNNLTNWVAVGSCPTAPSSGFFTADNPGSIAYPGPEFPGQGQWLYSVYNNTYDAGAKTFWMHYGYGVGSTGQNGWSRSFYEKWVRQ